MDFVQTICLVITLMSLIAVIMMTVYTRALERQVADALRIAHEAIDLAKSDLECGGE